jgi:hypothetical protein
MRWFLLFLFFACTAHAQEIVTLNTRPGITQSFFIANMGERKAEAAALLFIGGGGNIRLRMEEGQPKFGANNFLPRSRAEFIRNGILPVIMDNPSDQQAGGGMSDAFRQSEAHAADVRGRARGAAPPPSRSAAVHRHHQPQHYFGRAPRPRARRRGGGRGAELLDVLLPAPPAAGELQF